MCRYPSILAAYLQYCCSYLTLSKDSCCLSTTTGLGSVLYIGQQLKFYSKYSYTLGSLNFRHTFTKQQIISDIHGTKQQITFRYTALIRHQSVNKKRRLKQVKILTTVTSLLILISFNTAEKNGSGKYFLASWCMMNLCNAVQNSQCVFRACFTIC